VHAGTACKEEKIKIKIKNTIKVKSFYGIEKA
jgi:hypothetical protein